MRIAYTHLMMAAGLLVALHGCGSDSVDPGGGTGGGAANGGTGGGITPPMGGNGNNSGAEGGDGGNGGDAGEGGQPDIGGGTGGGGTGGTGGTGGGGGGGTGGDPVSCPVTLRFRPGGSPSRVVVAGEWQGFNEPSAPVMTPDGSGDYVATLQLDPGLHAYKYVVNGNDWRLDPTQGRRKYVGGEENSAVKVPDCRLPTWTVESSTVARPSAGAGTYNAVLRFRDGIEGSGPDVAGFTYTLQHNGTSKSVSVNASAAGDLTIALTGLEDGKYRLLATPRTANGKVGEPLRLVFWVEQEAFSWKDALIYMVLTDRFRDGDPSNNAPATPGADQRGDWQGGDLQGVRAAIADGTLDKLGVRAIWLSPFQTNPTTAYPAADGTTKVTGYHGYWPIKAREVDPRLGGATALRDLVKEAHAHGIRILQDYVVNHVHEEHEYFKAHPEWFRTGCVCGTSGCDWTEHALDCLFATYMPDINHSVPAANAAFVADAVWWMDEFDLDGLRVDAVKHVEEVAIRNLAADVRETFEAAGTRNFLMGETAMGWNDCGDPCNDENYGTISRYIGPYALDGQFDFVLYHGVSKPTFTSEEKGMFHADYWFQHSMDKYPHDAIMTPYIGSHDEPRFVTRADPNNESKAYNQWFDPAGPPSTALPYERARIAFAWLINLPGAPLMYYGDEYGQWGGADPNNRAMWKASSALNSNEQATLEFVRKLGIARKNVPALRRGAYVSLHVTEDTLVFGRKPTSGPAAIVGLTRSGAPVTLTTDVSIKLNLAAGTVFHDHLGGPNVTVSGGDITFTIPARGAVVLAP